MKATRSPRVKICCISSIEEAATAVECGASALGLVSQMPSGPGIIAEDRIAEIAAVVPPAVGSFLLTSNQDANEIITQHRRCRTTCVQICDRLTSGSYTDLKNAMPGISIIQVIHVVDEASVEEALSVAHNVDALLLDSGNQSLAIKELGGTGRTHNWELSRVIREQASVPVFLAGGLNAANARQAIVEVRPFGLDVCSGVRTDGKLDRTKLQAFFQAVTSAA